MGFASQRKYCQTQTQRLLLSWLSYVMIYFLDSVKSVLLVIAFVKEGVKSNNTHPILTLEWIFHSDTHTNYNLHIFILIFSRIIYIKIVLFQRNVSSVLNYCPQNKRLSNLTPPLNLNIRNNAYHIEGEGGDGVMNRIDNNGKRRNNDTMQESLEAKFVDRLCLLTMY